MITAVLVVYLVVVLLMVGVILIQKNESGGFVSSATGGLITARGSKNLLTRLTAILASLFFGLSLLLAVLFRHDVQGRSSLFASSPSPAKTLPKEKVETPPSPESVQKKSSPGENKDPGEDKKSQEPQAPVAQ